MLPCGAAPPTTAVVVAPVVAVETAVAVPPAPVTVVVAPVAVAVMAGVAPAGIAVVVIVTAPRVMAAVLGVARARLVRVAPAILTAAAAVLPAPAQAAASVVPGHPAKVVLMAAALAAPVPLVRVVLTARVLLDPAGVALAVVEVAPLAVRPRPRRNLSATAKVTAPATAPARMSATVNLKAMVPALPVDGEPAPVDPAGVGATSPAGGPTLTVTGAVPVSTATADPASGVASLRRSVR